MKSVSTEVFYKNVFLKLLTASRKQFCKRCKMTTKVYRASRKIIKPQMVALKRLSGSMINFNELF